MFTARMTSLMRTSPLPSQSPRQIGTGEARVRRESGKPNESATDRTVHDKR